MADVSFREYPAQIRTAVPDSGVVFYPGREVEPAYGLGVFAQDNNAEGTLELVTENCEIVMDNLQPDGQLESPVFARVREARLADGREMSAFTTQICAGCLISNCSNRLRYFTLGATQKYQLAKAAD